MDAKRAFTERSISLLLNVSNPHKFWSVVKASVFGASFSLPLLLLGRRDRLVWS